MTPQPRRRVRRDVILRRFLAGETVNDLVVYCYRKGMRHHVSIEHVNQVIRDALNRRRAP